MKQNKRKVIYLVRANINLNLGGGRRDSQIINELKNVLDDVISIHDEKIKRLKDNYKPAFFRSISKFKIPIFNQKIKNFATRGKYKIWDKNFRDYYFQLWIKDFCLSQYLENLNLNSNDLVIMDDPIYLSNSFRILNKKKIPIIAHCQNLESLVYQQVSKKYQINAIKKEVEMLKKCELALCISREETWLLNNLGIRALYYPYKPDSDHIENMKKLSLNRSVTPKKDILMFGSAVNMPTYDGMKRVIIQFDQFKAILSQEDCLLIGGYNTEQLKQFVNHKAIKILGTLEKSELDDLFCRVKAILIYQEKGSGALTRVKDIMAGNIPIVANSNALRSYYNTEGIFEFTHPSELGLINKILNTSLNERRPYYQPIPNLSGIIQSIKLAGSF